jgi:transposase
MALGRRKEKQVELFIPTAELARGPGHPFYTKLNEVLAKVAFDPFVKDVCAPFYKDGGRPGIPPGVYFRMLFIGYFEGIDSQRGIAWRCADSLALRAFLGIGLTEATPVHASMTIIPPTPARTRLRRGLHLGAGLLGLTRIAPRADLGN